MADKKKLLRYFACTIEIIVIYLLNETPGLIPPVFGAHPALLLPVIASTAVFESETAAMGLGPLCGVLFDLGVSSGVALGFYTLLLSILHFYAELTAVHLLRANLLTDLLLSTAVVGLTLLLQWPFHYVFSGYEYPGFMPANHLLPCFVYTLPPVLLTYAFSRAFVLNVRESTG